MNNRVFFGIAGRIIIIFVIAIAMTFIPENLRGFFGDTYKPCTGTFKDNYGNVRILDNCNGLIDDDYQWGIRHYWFYWMVFLLFCLSVVNVIIGSYELINKYYK